MGPGAAAQGDIFIALDTLIWALFAVDLGVKVAVATDRLAYLRQHWLDVLIVAVPFFRPLRILRLFLFGSRAVVGARRVLHLDFLLVSGIGLVILAATAVASVEAGACGSIRSFPEALWWAVTTITTVGYGDAVPVTPAGRAVAFVLMLGGITLFSGLTANLASFLTRAEGKGEDAHQAALERLTREVEALRQEVARLRGGVS